MKVKGAFLESSGAYSTTEVDAGEEYEVISNFVGGFITSVTTKNFGGLVGYVHDEGLLLGLPVNPIASTIFGRYLVGPCVVYGALDKNGHYDGEEHDVPSELLDKLPELHALMMELNGESAPETRDF
jgi:hypothetical protein